jgi:hypothetical protein
MPAAAQAGGTLIWGMPAETRIRIRQAGWTTYQIT